MKGFYLQDKANQFRSSSHTATKHDRDDHAFAVIHFRPVGEAFLVFIADIYSA
jgi:hypothetical protein